MEVSSNNATWTLLKTYTTTTGTSTGFIQENAISLPPNFINQPTVYIRFNYSSPYSYFWAVDNVSITGNQSSQSSITWEPYDNLYTDAAATVNYTGSAASTVYAKLTPDAIYLATATSPAGCTSSAGSQIALSTVPQWTGNAGTGWNTAANWCSGVVPTAGSNVIIPSGRNEPASDWHVCHHQ